jgi:hypothetical protein
MPIHDWTHVEAGIYHDFHQTWILEIKRALNAGVLPSDYYALAEQSAGGPVPDVLTLRGSDDLPSESQVGGSAIALATAPPQVRYHSRVEEEAIYANLADRISVRHRSGHDVVAMIELVSPGNKNSRHGLGRFVQKATELLRNGVHLLVIDPFPPGPRDPNGIHKAIWEQIKDEEFLMPPDKRLTLASYLAGIRPEAFVELVAVGDRLTDMPIFLSLDEYVPVPLEGTYARAWEAVPSYWQEVVAGQRRHSSN